MPASIELEPSPPENTSWKRVSIIAAMGFVFGVVWPRAAGLKPGPSAPEATTAASTVDPRAEAAPAAVPSATAPGSAPAIPAATGSTDGSDAGTALSTLTIGRGVVLSCRDDAGESHKGKECGDTAALDAFAETRLRRLASCNAAATGKLSAVITFDFKQNRALAEVGKSTSATPAGPLGACLKEHFQASDVSAVTHTKVRYVMAYAVNFKPSAEAPSTAPSAPEALPSLPSTAPSAAEEPEAPSLVAKPGDLLRTEWDPTLVREAPLKGTIIERLPKGSAVRIAAIQGSWYKVAFGADFTKEGWVFKNALAPK